MKNKKHVIFFALALFILCFFLYPIENSAKVAQAKEDVIRLRVCNWEEYMDLGGWDEEERILLDNGADIMGENPLYKDFEEWYYENYGIHVEVEYSCFGTNEDLYNQLTMGDTFDLVCPSDYMIMKLMAEGKLEAFSNEFFDADNGMNYYTNGVSPYIADVFAKNKIGDKSWDQYAACYMWGITGVLYNPEYLSYEEAATWSVFWNKDYYRSLTLKDNVRDTYFAALGNHYKDLFLSEEFLNRDDYDKALQSYMNDVSKDTIDEVLGELQDAMGNIYALETDSGKADLVSGKIVGGYQWSGDAVYAMDLAEEDDIYLSFAVPVECTNLWFDGWVMLKDGIDNDPIKKQAAEAFINFVSRPDNAVRNMHYIGYTSAISGGEDDTVFSYLNECYGAGEDAEETIDYSLDYFFSKDASNVYVVTTTPDQVNRQFYTQYPSKEIIRRAAVMGYFDATETKNINQMWIDIRCYDLSKTPIVVWGIAAALILLIVLVIVHKRANQLWRHLDDGKQ